MSYWKPATATAEARTKRLSHASSNQFGRVEDGDTVWLVTVRSGSLELIGKIEVESVCDQEDAAERLEMAAHDLRDDSHHLIATDGGLTPVWLDIHELEPRIRFISTTGKDRLDLSGGRVANQLQTMRELTPESAEILEEAFQANYQEPSDDDEEEEEEPGEICPFCDAFNNWGEMNTCEHHIGVVFDGSQLDSDIANSLQIVLCSLAEKMDQIEAMGKKQLLTKSAADKKTVRLVLENGHSDFNDINTLTSLFDIREGEMTVQGEGMLGGSACSLFSADPGELESMAKDLERIDALFPSDPA